MLIVEDNTLIAEVMATILQPVASTKIVGTLGDAIAALKSGIWTVVVLDLTLPDSKCHNTLAAIETIVQLGARVVIVVTGSPVDDRLVEVARAAGASQTIGKSPSLDVELLAAVARV